jgi:[ribosomal protein S5]-alanine N-acetyltransferase
MEVIVNGQRLCVAGVSSGVLSFLLTYVRRNPAARPPHEEESSPGDYEAGWIELSMGGMSGRTHVDWTRGYVDPGDEVVVRVLGPGSADPAQARASIPMPPMKGRAILGDERTTLRELIGDDLEFLTELLQDDDVRRWVPNGESAEIWLRHQQEHYETDQGGYWLIVDNQTSQLVGVAGVIMTEVEGERLPLLGCMIHPKFRRQHYGSDGAWGSIIHLFSSLKQDVAYALVRSDNELAMSFAGRLGMKPLRSVQHGGAEHALLSLQYPGD